MPMFVDFGGTLKHWQYVLLNICLLVNTQTLAVCMQCQCLCVCADCERSRGCLLQVAAAALKLCCCTNQPLPALVLSIPFSCCSCVYFQMVSNRFLVVLHGFRWQQWFSKYPPNDFKCSGLKWFLMVSAEVESSRSTSSSFCLNLFSPLGFTFNFVTHSKIVSLHPFSYTF